MPLTRRLTAFASVLCVVVVQLLLAGDNAAACGERMMSSSGLHAAGAMATMPGMEKAGAPSGEDSTTASDHDSDCPDSGGRAADCRAMGACAPVVALVATPPLSTRPPSAPVATIGVEGAPRSWVLGPATPPPRA